MRKLKMDIIDVLTDKLVEYKGISTSGENLANLLLEEETANEAVCSTTDMAVNWIKDNWNGISELIYENKQLDIDFRQAFSAPDKFQVAVFLYCANKFLWETPFVKINWQKNFILTDSVIKKIQTELEALI